MTGLDSFTGSEIESSVRRIEEQNPQECFIFGDALPGGYYRLTKPTENLRLVLDSLGIHADLRLPTIRELRQLKYSFDKASIMQP